VIMPVTCEKKEMSATEYGQRVVAFIDVLGWTQNTSGSRANLQNRRAVRSGAKDTIG
jgi:hypothetical protein